MEHDIEHTGRLAATLLALAADQVEACLQEPRDDGDAWLRVVFARLGVAADLATAAGVLGQRCADELSRARLAAR